MSPLKAIFLISIAGMRRLRTQLVARTSRSIMHFGRDLHVGAGCKFWAPDGIKLGDSVYIGKDVTIECNAEIGNYVLIANRVAIVGRHDHDFRKCGVPVRFSPWIGGTEDGPYRKERTIVEDDVWLGFGAILLSGVRIGRGAVVASGSVVTRDVAPYSVVGGNPARLITSRFAEEDTKRRHELMIERGEFRSSERGYQFWCVRPGPDEPRELA